MASFADDRTQLQKDTESVAGVIPIYPWIKNGLPKGNIPPRTYARDLLEAKTQNNQPGSIVQCNSDGCEGGIGKGMFWRSVETGENMVPTGWSNYGGPGQFTLCALCKASDVENGFVYAELEEGRVDFNMADGSSGGTPHDNAASNVTDVGSSSSSSKPKVATKNGNSFKDLLEEANKLWKDEDGNLKIPSERYEALLIMIRKEINKKRADAADSRKRKKEEEEEKESKRQKTEGGKRRRKKRTKKRRKSKGRKRRRKRTRKRRRSRRRKRTRKRR
jgi:hypothetical protein